MWLLTAKIYPKNQVKYYPKRKGFKMNADVSRYSQATYNELGDYLRIPCKPMNF